MTCRLRHTIVGAHEGGLLLVCTSERTNDIGERLGDDGDLGRLPQGGGGPGRAAPPPRRLAQPQHPPLQRHPVPRLHPLVGQRRFRQLRIQKLAHCAWAEQP
jgi:hypothetical protein